MEFFDCVHPNLPTFLKVQISDIEFSKPNFSQSVNLPTGGGSPQTLPALPHSLIICQANKTHHIMAALTEKSRFIVISLPRTGSTSLARLLDCHKQINCLIEPFHPSNYGGKFHVAIQNEKTFDSVLELVWAKWNGIKHVWDVGGWPFTDHPEFNTRMLLSPRTKIIFLTRRNLLQRFVSNYFCRQINYWIGDKSEFHSRLDNIQIRSLEPEQVRIAIQQDIAEIERCWNFIADNNLPAIHLCYEHLFRTGASKAEQLEITNSILKFLGFKCVDQESFSENWQYCFDSSINQWSSAELYYRIPGIDRIEKEIGSDETGWLFREGKL